MNTPLYDKLIEYTHSKIPFHMPGHKFGKIADIENINLALLDNTEVVGMDNLYESESVIKEAMEGMAKFYGSKESLFLTNGSTVGILVSILSICKEGEKLIVARNCHHSVWSGLVLSGAIPIYVNPQYIEEDNLLGGIRPQDIKTALEENPDAKGVVIVSPTYEGIVSDIETIAQIIHDKNKILIVDEAHGAHFIVNPIFPKSSIALGADLVINSLHKTLPALTQSALLHLCSHRVQYDKLVSTLKMVQTSSPSYMMMGLMDYMRGYLIENHLSIKQRYIDELITTREHLRSLKYLRLIEKPLDRYDISKIIIDTAGSNIDGYRLSEILNEKYNIVIEAALSSHIIIMTTLADNEHTLNLLQKALQGIDDTLTKTQQSDKVKPYILKEITYGTSPRNIHFGLKEWQPISHCEGRVAARHIMLYPPGIPILCIGEVITYKHIQVIHELKEKVQGVKQMDEVINVEVSK